MSALGDPFSMLAFASNGRDDVEMTTVKAFHEPYDRACVGRLAALSSGLSTRLGTALRHAGELQHRVGERLRRDREVDIRSLRHRLLRCHPENGQCGQEERKHRVQSTPTAAVS